MVACAPALASADRAAASPCSADITCVLSVATFAASAVIDCCSPATDCASLAQPPDAPLPARSRPTMAPAPHCFPRSPRSPAAGRRRASRAPATARRSRSAALTARSRASPGRSSPSAALPSPSPARSRPAAESSRPRHIRASRSPASAARSTAAPPPVSRSRTRCAHPARRAATAERIDHDQHHAAITTTAATPASPRRRVRRGRMLSPTASAEISSVTPRGSAPLTMSTSVRRQPAGARAARS